MKANFSDYLKAHKPAIIVGALFVYMCVMAIVNLDTITVYHEYLTYFGTMAAELVVLTILYFVLRKREKLRRERQEDLRLAEQQRRELQQQSAQDNHSEQGDK